MNRNNFYQEISQYYVKEKTDGTRWIRLNDDYMDKYKNAEPPDEQDLADYDIDIN